MDMRPVPRTCSDAATETSVFIGPSCLPRTEQYWITLVGVFWSTRTQLSWAACGMTTTATTAGRRTCLLRPSEKSVSCPKLNGIIKLGYLDVNVSSLYVSLPRRCLLHSAPTSLIPCFCSVLPVKGRQRPASSPAAASALHPAAVTALSSAQGGITYGGIVCTRRVLCLAHV